MKVFNPYKSRPIRFIEVFQYKNWYIKLYSISIFQEHVKDENIQLAKSYLKKWLLRATDYNLETYNIANLILHEFKDGCFAIINWWTDENMLQSFVYLKKNNVQHFEIYSNNGINTCVWEMAIWWHERNAWIKHILSKNNNPDFESYLNDVINENI